MPSAVTRLFTGWMAERTGRGAGPVLLTQRRIFILPTRSGLGFGFFLLLMLVGSMNYNLSLGYVLTFFLASMAMVSILHGFRNLARLAVRPGKAPPVFAGETAGFGVALDNAGALPRYSVGVAGRGAATARYADVPPGETALLRLEVPAPRRGLLRAGPFRVFTRFPLGLFYAWSNLELDMECLVYPRPDQARLPLPLMEPRLGSGIEHGIGDEDFLGLRGYRPGDSLRQVAWKAAARSEVLLTKQFTGRAEAELWLDWDLLAGMETEARLSRLTRWVLDAHAAGVAYGLRLPDRTLEPTRGEEHKGRCLRALALYGIET